MISSRQIGFTPSSDTGAEDFLKHLSEVHGIGFHTLVIHISNGCCEYRGVSDLTFTSSYFYRRKIIRSRPLAAEFQAYLVLFKVGGASFLQFCSDCAKTGVERWVVDLVTLTCTYYSVEGMVVLVESIPAHSF